MDPLASLPPELALKVLEALPFRSIVAAQRISRAWLNFIRSEPTLWHHLDLTRFRRECQTSIIDTAINVAAEHVTTVTLYYDRMVGYDEAFEKLAQKCPLEKVNLMQTGVIMEERQLALTLRDLKGPLRELRMQAINSHPIKLRSFFIEPHIDNLELLDLDGYQTMTDHCISHATFPRLRTLRFTARGQQGAGPVGLLRDFTDRFPVLRSLELSNLDRRRNPSDFSSCTQLQRLDLRLHVMSVRNLKLPPNLKRLRLESQISITAGDVYDEVTHFDLPKLEYLELSLIGMTMRDIGAFLYEGGEEWSGLTHLILSQLGESSWAEAASFFSHPRLRNLRNLRLHHTTGLEEARVRLIVDQLKHMRWLDLCQSDITNRGVSYVVQNSGAKSLHLRGCQNISDEVVEWARGRNIKVVR